MRGEATRVRRDRPGLSGQRGQTTTEYVTILGIVVAATIGVLATLAPMARVFAALARRIVLDLSG